MDWKPRIMIYKEPAKKSCLVSCRWLKTGFDALKGGDTLFVQFGRKPVKFFYWTPKNIPPPLFLVSTSWHTKYKCSRFRFGYTRKPLDLVKAWRKECTKSSAPKHHSNTMINKTSCGTGL